VVNSCLVKKMSFGKGLPISGVHAIWRSGG
jgi:hypothetical protein